MRVKTKVRIGTWYTLYIENSDNEGFYELRDAICGDMAKKLFGLKRHLGRGKSVEGTLTVTFKGDKKK